MWKATYLIPFADFDYKPLAAACGLVHATQAGFLFIAEGRREAIDKFSNNLDFDPESIYWKPE